MPRLIDADKARKEATVDLVVHLLDRQPTIDAVPVVRCKNCKHYNLQALACTHNNFNGWIGMDGFCSYGEYVTNSK